MGRGIWDRSSNETGWNALLGDDVRGGPDVSPYAAPSRGTDLAGLPPAFIDVGSAETFRDEDVAHASRIWQAGGPAELHVARRVPRSTSWPPRRDLSGRHRRARGMAAPSWADDAHWPERLPMTDAALPFFGEDDDADGHSVDETFANAHRVSLDAHSWVEHVPGWLTGAGSTFDELPRTARWSSARLDVHPGCSSRA